jgi:hypothetical protein
MSKVIIETDIPKRVSLIKKLIEVTAEPSYIVSGVRIQKQLISELNRFCKRDKAHN